MSSDDLTKKVPTEDKLDSLLALVQEIATDVKTLNGRVDALDQKVDARLHDTRPLWEGVEARLENVESEIGSLRNETQAGFRGLDRQMDTLSGNITRLQANQRDLEDRVDKLQEKPHRPLSPVGGSAKNSGGAYK
jgi:outer membrane murein-binding lipoprotein Lpp